MDEETNELEECEEQTKESDSMDKDQCSAHVKNVVQKVAKEVNETPNSLLHGFISSEIRYRKLSIVTQLLILLLLTLLVADPAFLDVHFKLSEVTGHPSRTDASVGYNPVFKFSNSGIKDARDVHATIEIYNFNGSYLKYQREDVEIHPEDRDIGRIFSSNNKLEIRLNNCECHNGITYKFIVTLSWEGGSQTLTGSFSNTW